MGTNGSPASPLLLFDALSVLDCLKHAQLVTGYLSCTFAQRTLLATFLLLLSPSSWETGLSTRSLPLRAILLGEYFCPLVP